MCSRMLVSVAAAAALAAVLVSARPQGAYELPNGFQEILSAPLQQSFTCDGLPYGYYADVDNNCEVFHVCLPIQDDAGSIIETKQWSFVCGNQTVFDQETLTCNHINDALPCSEAPSIWESVNSNFGVVEN